MHILVLSATVSDLMTIAHIEVDETFQLSSPNDRLRLINYLEEETEVETSDIVLSAVPDGTALPVFIDHEGDVVTADTYALPPREEIDAEVADIVEGDDD